NAPRVQRDRYLGAELVRDATAAMLPAAGTAGLEALADLLAAALEGDHEGRHDFSYIWRPHLAGERSRDLRDALVSALRDGDEEVSRADPERLGEIIDLLEAREQSIFHRLALDLLARQPDDQLIVARLTNRGFSTT